jgi:hypothetical protein
MAARISNVSQTHNTFVKFCALENSVDEAVMEAVRRLSFSIDAVVDGKRKPA